MGYRIRKARVPDIKTVHGLLTACADKGELLPRPYSALYSHMRDFYVLAEEGSDASRGAVLGCCALAICWEDIAEVRSLAIADKARGQGWGKRLVEACLSEAVTLGLYRVFTLTYQVEFFAKMGFAEVGKEVLPQKVWADCVNCAKFPDCDETAMMMDM